MNFYNKNTFIRLSRGYSDVAAPGAGGSDPADRQVLHFCTNFSICNFVFADKAN